MNRIAYLLNERDDDDERGRDECPDPADDCPRGESGQVEHVDAEHGAGPDADEERREEDARDVRRDLRGAELSDDDVERGAIVEVVALFQVQFALLGMRRIF